MKIRIKLKDKWKYISFCTKKYESTIRYWGGLKFDIVKLYNQH